MPPPGQGAAEADRHRRVPQHAVQLPLGEDGVEKFVVTPELQSEDHDRPRPAAARPGLGTERACREDGAGLYRIEVTDTSGSGSRKLLNLGAPADLRESFRLAEGNLLARSRELLGDRDPREHDLTVQVRALDAAKAGSGLSLPITLAMASAVLQRSVKGGLIAAGQLTLGGGIEAIRNAASLAEHAMEKGAATLLLPVSARRQLIDVSDEVATRVTFLFYADATDALVKALDE